ncbi:MAG TPA: EamA/RhaT family transporter [Proteobacteria bacterium]|nr:EamA/RhaT family transporter [Pseudomonadota bacterium]
MAISDRSRGTILSLAGVLILSMDALALRLSSTSPWTMCFWRGPFMAIALFIGLRVYYGKSWVRHCRAIGRFGILIALLLGGRHVIFVVAVSYTTIADVVVIVSTTPLFAALFSAIFLKERTPLRTWIAILVALGGIAVIFAGSLGGGTTTGSILALVTAICGAGSLVLIRREKKTNMIPALALSGIFVFLAAVPFAHPLLITVRDLTVFAVAGLIILPVSLTLVNLAPRYIPAPEVGLLMLLNVVEAPLLVWLFQGETPGKMTFVGGSIIVAALSVHFTQRRVK